MKRGFAETTTTETGPEPTGPEPTVPDKNKQLHKTGREYYDMCEAFDDYDVDVKERKNKYIYKYIFNLIFTWFTVGSNTLKDVPTVTGVYDHSIVRLPASYKDLRKILPIDLMKKLFDRYDKVYIDNNSFLKSRFYNTKGEFGIKKDIKVTITWLICYLKRKYIGPNTKICKPGWEYYQCSHRCAEEGLEKYNTDDLYIWRCIDPLCLFWEDASTNQSRGNRICRAPCTHDNCQSGLCNCQCNDGFRTSTGEKYHDPPCW